MELGGSHVSEPERQTTNPNFVHDLTNALTIVMGQLFLLQFDETVSPSIRERLNSIEIAAERINNLVRSARTASL
jgi:signal transduction histidine kinase